MKPRGKPTSSTASLVSERSDRSKEFNPYFSLEQQASGKRTKSSSGPPLKRCRRSPSEDGSSSTSSLVSTRTDHSKDFPPEFKASLSLERPSEIKETIKPRGDPTSSTASLVSERSDRSKEFNPYFSLEQGASGKSEKKTLSIQQSQEKQKLFEGKVMELLMQAVKTPEKVLPEEDREFSCQSEDALTDQPRELGNEAKEAAVKIALHILRTMKEDDDANKLEERHYGVTTMYQKILKSFLKTKSESLLEITEKWPVPLQKIYTELYLIEGDSGEMNREHEIRQVEAAFNKRKCQEIQIKTEDLFKPIPNKKNGPIRTVLTKGIAGIGKTVLTQKFILDWSMGRANQNIQLLFSLPFRELNLLKNQEKSLMELLHIFSPGLKESGITDLNNYKILVVLDGLDECRLPLDFSKPENLRDVFQPVFVDRLLTNLIAGNLLPNAYLWITTRPGAANCIPEKYVDRLTEIRGFNYKQKEQYFYKKIDDETLAKRVIANIKSTRSLYIMCHVPVFCWISSIVLGEMCAKVGGGKMPKTLTQMYIHFVAHQTKQIYIKYDKEQQLDSHGNNKVIMSLGKLAFDQLEKGNQVFYEEDLRECGIDVQEASVYSGVCTQVFREESCMQTKVYCFVHLSVQEFLAALYVHVMYSVERVNLMVKIQTRIKQISELHKSAVNKALQSDNGHLDLFLRFLLGLSLQSSHDLLKGLKIQVESWDSKSHEETTEYIKGRINLSESERYINLLHCLNELKDISLVDEIQNHLDLDRKMETKEWSAAQWAALVFLLLTSPQKSEEITLKKYSRTEKGFHNLLPVIKASRSAMLNDCNLTEVCCRELSSTLSISSNELHYLNLSDNRLGDTGIKILSQGLQSPNCKLKTLRLNRCDLTDTSCKELASVLKCPTSSLRELDLSDNDIKDSGVELLSKGLRDWLCKLEILRLSFCNITEDGCQFLAKAVKSNPSYLSELDLSYNYLGDSGVRLISEAAEESRCELTKLRVDHRAEHWFKPGLRKYGCSLTMDLNTAHKLLVLSDGNRKVCQGSVEQQYPDNPERFDYWAQVMFKEGLRGRYYWEMEWDGKWVGIGLAYKSIERKGPDNNCVIGYNRKSWSLHCFPRGYRAYHNFESTVIEVPPAGFGGVAMYLDWEAGMLSFYRVSSGRSLTHLHTFSTKFTSSLYLVFRVWGEGSSVRLCQVENPAEENTV